MISAGNRKAHLPGINQYVIRSYFVRATGIAQLDAAACVARAAASYPVANDLNWAGWRAIAHIAVNALLGRAFARYIFAFVVFNLIAGALYRVKLYKLPAWAGALHVQHLVIINYSTSAGWMIHINPGCYISYIVIVHRYVITVVQVDTNIG